MCVCVGVGGGGIVRRSAVISLRNGDEAPLAWIRGDPLTDERQHHVRIRSPRGRSGLSCGSEGTRGQEVGGQGDAGFTPPPAGSLLGMSRHLSITLASLER